MVYLTYPPEYTEEEEMLQKKYQKLRRKKKALQQLKAPKQENPTSPLKRTHEAKVDAKETAKKLLKSGAISAIKIENKEKQGFKRAKGMERRRGLDRMGSSMVTGYQPFSASHPQEDDTTSDSSNAKSLSRAGVKNLYDSFVSSSSSQGKEDQPPRRGNTIYVKGYRINEDIIHKGFTPFGSIINISLEPEKNSGFVTFEKVESAEKAIKEMNGKVVSDVHLMVSLARRQPLIPTSDGIQWTTLAASNLQKSAHKDKRDLVTYEDIHE